MTVTAHHGSSLTGRSGTPDRPGLAIFAGALLVLLSLLNGLDGIAAVANSHVFVSGASYVFGDLRSWGWVMLALAVVQLVTAYGVLVTRATWARWTGVAVLGLNAFAQMAFIPSSPLWSLTIIALDVVGIYGLTIDRPVTVSDLTGSVPGVPEGRAQDKSRKTAD